MVDQNKQELHRSIWKLVNDLRGAIDDSEFRDYILGFLFYRYISDDFSKYINQRPGVGVDYRYEEENNEAEWIEYMKDILIQEKGYFIYPNDLFTKINRKNIEKLGEELKNAFSRIEESIQNSKARKNFEGLFKLINLEDNKLGEEIIQRNKKIKEIMDGIQSIKYQIGGSDIFGEAYEYLIGIYADKAGKTGGEVYTPPEVSQLLVKLVSSQEHEIKTVYDPTCGSGSLLLKFGNEKNIHFYGQEINFTTYNICRINMFLHNIPWNRFNIELGDTLTDDKFKNQNFDVIVSSLPFGVKWDGENNADLKQDPRFAGPGCLAPNSKSDYAFIMHSLYHLKEDGVATMVCFSGILFREQKELNIRRYLIENNYIDAIIQLSDNLFFSKSVSVCIIVFKKNKKDENIFFINAKDCFVNHQGKNKLTENDINKIHKTYVNKKDEEGFSRLVNKEEIRKNNHSLSVGTYLTQIEQDEVEIIDIETVNKNSKELYKKIYEINKSIDKIIQDI